MGERETHWRRGEESIRTELGSAVSPDTPFSAASFTAFLLSFAATRTGRTTHTSRCGCGHTLACVGVPTHISMRGCVRTYLLEGILCSLHQQAVML